MCACLAHASLARPRLNISAEGLRFSAFLHCLPNFNMTLQWLSWTSIYAKLYLSTVETEEEHNNNKIKNCENELLHNFPLSDFGHF